MLIWQNKENIIFTLLIEIINFSIPSGIQGNEHPNPGQAYYAVGFPRICYLPDNTLGRRVLRLLQIAFERRLIFTIGRSVTTGREDVVTWNEIHHKTELGPSTTGHGYPDTSYLERTLAELAAQGVTDGHSSPTLYQELQWSNFYLVLYISITFCSQCWMFGNHIILYNAVDSALYLISITQL